MGILAYTCMVRVAACVRRTIMDSMGIDMYGPGGCMCPQDYNGLYSIDMYGQSGCMCPQDHNGHFSIYMYGQGGCICPQDYNGQYGYRHVWSRWLHVSAGLIWPVRYRHVWSGWLHVSAGP